ncbi:MAG: hypothetical protein RL598_896, partial [Verrucomicrobiota bacterium]
RREMEISAGDEIGPQGQYPRNPAD